MWGLIQVVGGGLRLSFANPKIEQLQQPGKPGLCQPQQVHHVTPLGQMRMQVDFYDAEPELG